MDILEAAQSGNRKMTLVALRDSIAAAINDKPSGRDIAALSKRLMEVMDELDAIEEPHDDAVGFASVLDEL